MQSGWTREFLHVQVCVCVYVLEVIPDVVFPHDIWYLFSTAMFHYVLALEKCSKATRIQRNLFGK